MIIALGVLVLLETALLGYVAYRLHRLDRFLVAYLTAEIALHRSISDALQVHGDVIAQLHARDQSFVQLLIALDLIEVAPDPPQTVN